MSREFQSQELAILLKDVPLVLPRIGEEQKYCMGKAADTIAHVGLPLRFGDSFHAVAEVRFFPLQKNTCYKFTRREVPLYRAVEIGWIEFGSHVVSCDSGHVVYIDSSGQTQFINSSVEAFLYFVGRFTQSIQRRFSDANELFTDAKRVDENAFAELDGMWSVMIEEARTGLY